MKSVAGTEPVVVDAPAKINLALHVTGRRQDGYHLLDTAVAFAHLGDTLTARHGEDFSLSLSGRFATALEPGDANNLVLKAARQLHQHAIAMGFAISGGAHFNLKKELPVASGIGGGSADAAAALVALRTLWSLPDSFDLMKIAATLGADVPMCLASTPLRASGVGEILAPAPLAQDFHVVLVNCGIETLTKSVFNKLDGKFGDPMHALPAGGIDWGWLHGQRNDLQSPAVGMFPEIGETIGLLEQCRGVQLARMSGSGATCFGIFADAQTAQQAAQQIAGLHPEWWCVATVLPASGMRQRDWPKSVGGS